MPLLRHAVAGSVRGVVAGLGEGVRQGLAEWVRRGQTDGSREGRMRQVILKTLFGCGYSRFCGYRGIHRFCHDRYFFALIVHCSRSGCHCSYSRTTPNFIMMEILTNFGGSCPNLFTFHNYPYHKITLTWDGVDGLEYLLGLLHTNGY